MIPRALVLIDKIPLTSNGKVNRSQLSSHAIPKDAYFLAHEINNSDTESVILPILTETEILVKAIWIDILDLPNECNTW